MSGDDSYNSSTGIWTAPYTGRVKIEAVCELGNTHSTTFISIKRNNSGTTGAGEIVRGAYTSAIVADISQEIEVTQGDQISIHRYHDGAADNLGSTAIVNRVSFTRVAEYSAGQSANFGLATSTEYGLVKAPRVIHALSGTGTNNVYTDVGVDTIDLEVGTWILEMGVTKRITYSGTLNTDYGAQLAIGIHDAANNFIGAGATSACARSSSAANRLRGQVVNTTVADVTSPITINLVARIIVENFGATITNLSYFNGYIKATRIS